MSTDSVSDLLGTLISYPSVTPDETDCQNFIAEYLSDLDFKTDYTKKNSVQNMISTFGEGSPCLSFLGHTDVVPSGDVDEWSSNPFKLTNKDDVLIGRGTSDMKGGIACFMHAVREFISENKKFHGSIKIILTGDEEGDAIYGIRKLIEDNYFKNNKLDYCLVGEPSSTEIIGDVIRNGRRGSITGHLTISGVQGHVAYPDIADNPIHNSSKILSDLLNMKFDNGNKYFPPTSFQISNINAGTGADNVIPATLKIVFNIRYSTETNDKEIKSKITNILDSSGQKYNITWKHSGEPFLTTNNYFMDICKESIRDVNGLNTVVSTNGGTSDGRFMAKICDQVIELGLTNRSIHKVDECVRETDLHLLVEIYKKILSKVFL
tara:strand:- start:822 stop:1955 length:1134 start_codon:yes stop_codon:yes gene_type:complete